ncbi:MAG: hypothetical protein IT195_12465 [Microthrixaceae bacterium]|nr:hypothetical protein [Microthrixaceae bacterium]
MTTRTYAAGMTVALIILGWAWLTGSFIITLLGCALAIAWSVAVGAFVFAQPTANPAAPPAAAAPAAPAVPPPLGWSTPDQILDDMLGVTNPPTPPPDIDPDTGELLGDRVCRIEEVLTGMERTIEQLGNLIGEQSNLMANGLLELRRRVDQLEPPPQQQVLPLREAS